MANIQFFLQSRVAPKAGGTFWIYYISDKPINDSATVLNTGSLTVTEDFSNHRFALTIPKNDYSVSGGTTCSATFTFTDGTTQTEYFGVAWTGTDETLYFSDAAQGTISGTGGEKSMQITSNIVDSSNWTFTSTVYNPTTNTITTVTPEYTLNNKYSVPDKVHTYSSVADFRADSIAGNIATGDWVYVDGVVTEDPKWNDTYKRCAITLEDPNSSYFIYITDVYNINNKAYTAENYTEAAGITTIGLRYHSNWGSSSSGYFPSSGSDTSAYAFIQNGVVSTNPETRGDYGYFVRYPSFLGHTFNATIGANETENQLERFYTLIDGDGNPQTTTLVKQNIYYTPGTISLQYNTMDFPGDIMSGSNKITYSGINNALQASSSTSDFTASITQNGGSTYLNVRPTSSNVGGSSNKTAVITVSGVDRNGDTITATCNVTQHTDSVAINVVSRGTESNPLEVDWETNNQTYTVYGSGLNGIDRVYRVNTSTSAMEALSFTTTPTTYESYPNAYSVTVTIPRSTINSDQKWEMFFVAQTNYSLIGETSVGGTYILQKALPEGKITFTADTVYVHTFAGYAYSYFTTEDMDEESLTLSYSGDINLASDPSIIRNSSSKYVRIRANANTQDVQKTLTITLTGTDVTGVQRTATTTFIQVKPSEDSYIRLVTISSGYTYQYNDAAVTGYLYAKNVDNVDLTCISGTDFIGSVELTETSTADRYNFSAALNTNDTDSSRNGNYQFTGRSTVNGPFGTNVSEANSRYITQRCEPGSLTVSSNTLSITAAAGTNNEISYTAYRLNNVTATLEGVEGSVSLSDGKVVVTTPENTSYDDVTGTITISGTDYNGDTFTETIEVTKRGNIDISITPSSQTLAAGQVTATYNVVFTNVSDPQITYSGDYNFISSASIENGVLTVNTTDLSVRAAKTATITITGTTPKGTTFSKSATLTKTGFDGRILADTDHLYFKKTLSQTATDVHYTLEGFSDNEIEVYSPYYVATRVDSSENTIHIWCNTNNTSEERTGTVRIRKTDYKGDVISLEIPFTQWNYDPYLNVTPTEQTIPFGENKNRGFFEIDAKGFTSYKTTLSGDQTFVTHCYVDGKWVEVGLSTFNDRVTRTVTIKVDAIGPYPMSQTVTLSKQGPDGIITVPETLSISKRASSFDINVARDGVGDITADYLGDINITSYSFNSDKSILTVNYETNSTSETLTGEFTFVGVDYKGNTITAKTTVSQIPYQFQVTPKSQIVQYQQSTATVTVEAEDVTFTGVSFASGDIEQDSSSRKLVKGYSRDGNVVTINLDTFTEARETIVKVIVSGIAVDGKKVTDTAILRIWGVDGKITNSYETYSNPNIAVCNGDLYSNTKGCNPNGIVVATDRWPDLNFNFVGVVPDNVTTDSDWITVYYTRLQPDLDLANYTFLYPILYTMGIYWDPNEDGATNWDDCRVAHITATGTDYKGNKITKTTTITQYAVDPDLIMYSTGEEVEWNEYADYEVTVVGPALPPTITSNDFGQGLDYIWLGKWGDGIVRTNTVRVKPPANESLTEKCGWLKFTSNTLLCSKTLTATTQLCQKAKPVIITLTPGSYTVNRNAGSVTFAITVDGIDQSKLKVRSSGDMITSTSFNADKSILTVQYSGNPNVETRTGEVCVSDADSIVFNCATITQYGRDPELNVSNLIIDYNEQYSTSFIETKGVDNVSVAIDGDVIISDYTLTPTTGGYTLIVETPTNDSFNILRSTCTVTGTVSVGQYVGNTITKTFEIIKMAKDGVISINPTTQHIGKAGGPLTFDMFYGNINLSTVRSNYGTFSADKSKLYVNVGANNTPADRTITVIVTGNDNNSNATSATAVITQYTVDPFIEVNDIGISNTQQTVQVPINTKYIDNLTVEFEGDVVINDYTLVKTVGGYLLTIITADNLGDAPLYSTATFTGDITTEEGATLTKTVQVIKYGKEGIIYVDPAEFILKKAGGEVKVYLSYNNMDVASVTSNLGTFSDNKGVLIYDVAPNPDTVDRTITITISGNDVSGITKTAEVKIIQYGLDPYITITPASQTVRYNNDTAVYTVTSYKVTDLFVSFVGNIDITSYSLDNGLLTIISADNNEELSIIEEITVTGTSDYLETVSATATLTKMGTGGGIVIDPEYKIAGNAGLLAIPYYADRVDEDTVYAFINGDIDVSNISVNRAGKFILIEYGANGSSSRASTLIVTCNDEDGIPRTTTSTITQLPNTYSFSINPTRRTIGYQASTVTNSVVKSNITSISSFTYYGDMDATYTYDNDSTITIAAQTNSDSSRKYGVVSLTGVAGSGDTVTASGYILQNNEYWGDWGFEFIDSSQANVTVDGGGRKLYYDILSVNRSTADSIPYYVSGFVLSGHWGSLPSVRYRDGNPYIVIPINTREETRDVVATFTQEYSYLELQSRIHQEEGAIPDVHPIWEIDEMSSSIGNFIEYHITNDGEIIFAGKAYRYPDELKTTWSINDTVSNYLGNGIYFTDGIQQIPNYAKDFFVKTSANTKYVKTFYNSWAYKHTNYWLSDPIDTRIDPRQWLPVSFLSTNYPLINVGGKIYAALKENDGWTVMTNLKSFYLDCDGGFTVSGMNNSNIHYTVSSGDYVLYYSNAYGGWDSILLTGKVKKTDEIEHLNYRKRSNSQYKFSKINYQNNITPTWSLNTGITIDGNKMHHLLESTMVYLHNLDTNEIIPVVITNSQCEYLTRKNNGKRPFFYTITVEESNTKLRK